MSLRNSVRAFPALLRTGVAEAVAYRAEMIIWVLSTTMPFVMLALWSAVAAEAPVGRFDQPSFVAYFLAAFIVRQMTGSWAAWEMNYEVRSGKLAQRLMRPVHPLVTYAAENVGVFPLRLVVCAPVFIALLVIVGPEHVPQGVVMWGIALLALIGGWMVNLMVNFAIGSLSLYMESSLKVLDVWFTLFMAFSGYIVPIELFPEGLRAVLDWLPFRYQIGFPVEVMTNGIGLERALTLLAVQWGWVVALFGLTALLWTRGLSKFSAYGG